ncbi:MAG: trehalose-phosphatase [Deltaproteobacteria bacterium]|nr:trehalose-phosphatase [Deltaproteobacteria bacterium]
MAKYLLKDLEEIQKTVNGRKVSLFLDYDGTITPMVGRPEDARLSSAMKEVLKGLARLYPLTIISSRALRDLKPVVGLPSIVYAGNQGLEVRGEQFTMTFDIGRDKKEELEGIAAALKGLLHGLRGVAIEDKGLTLSVHYRPLDTKDFPFFAEKFDEVLAGPLSRSTVKVIRSKKAFDVRPDVGWDKGRAVEWILGRPGFSGTFPIYLGDDESDREAFRVLKGKGCSVFVGGADEEADYYLMAQDEVKTFLGWLLHRPFSAEGLFSTP